jgi:hypothetical protein
MSVFRWIAIALALLAAGAVPTVTIETPAFAGGCPPNCN